VNATSFIRYRTGISAGGLSKTLSSQLSITFIQLWVANGRAHGNASQQRLEIPEHMGGEVMRPGLQAGKGKFGFVRMKTLAHFQNFWCSRMTTVSRSLELGVPAQIVV